MPTAVCCRTACRRPPCRRRSRPSARSRTTVSSKLGHVGRGRRRRCSQRSALEVEARERRDAAAAGVAVVLGDRAVGAAAWRARRRTGRRRRPASPRSTRRARPANSGVDVGGAGVGGPLTFERAAVAAAAGRRGLVAPGGRRLVGVGRGGGLLDLGRLGEVVDVAVVGEVAQLVLHRLGGVGGVVGIGVLQLLADLGDGVLLVGARRLEQLVGGVGGVLEAVVGGEVAVGDLVRQALEGVAERVLVAAAPVVAAGGERRRRGCRPPAQLHVVPWGRSVGERPVVPRRPPVTAGPVAAAAPAPADS